MSTPRYVPNEVSLADITDYTGICNFIRSGSCSSPKFTVTYDGINYHVYKDDGSLTYTTGYFSTAMNSEVFNGLTSNRTSPEHVLVKGNMSIDNTILLPNLVDIEIQGTHTAVNSLNKSLYKNANQSTNNYGIRLRGFGFIDGNGANNSGGRVIDFVNATNVPAGYSSVPYANYPSALYMEDLGLFNQNSSDTMVNINFNGSPGSTLKWRNITVSPNATIVNTNYSVVLTNVFDSDIQESFINGAQYALYSVGCSGLRMNFSYFNGCAVMYGNIMCSMQANYWDNSNAYPNLIMAYCKWNYIHDTNFHIVNSNGFTTDGIQVADTGAPFYSINNRFNNLAFTRSGFGGTNRFSYGIEETNAQDGPNIYTCIDGLDCTTGALRVLNPNSDYGHILGSVATT